MSIKRPVSNESPDNQTSHTPSGKKVPMAMSLMVDSMVRMIQQGSSNQSEMNSEENIQPTHGD